MHSIATLKREDGQLFGPLFATTVEACVDCDDGNFKERKLHEVCINHKLAEHLAENIRRLVENPQTIFVDIEFNREGLNYKLAPIDGQVKEVRPDIVVHNRKWGEDAFNLLIVECKKDGASAEAKQKDVTKIQALMEDAHYKYHFGLQVIYGIPFVTGTLFYKNRDGAIKEEFISV